MKNGINTAGLTKLQSGIDQIINVVFEYIHRYNCCYSYCSFNLSNG